MKKNPSDLWKLIPKTLGERKAKLVVSVLMVLVVLATMGSMWAHKQVEVSVDNKTLTLKTSKATVEEILQDAQIVLGPKDEVRPGLTAKLQEGMQIQVLRAIPVTILVDGRKMEEVTPKPTVGELLDQYNIKVSGKDLVEPGIHAKVTSHMKIKVSRVMEKLETRRIIISNQIERRPNDSLPKGQVKVIQAGANGLKERTTKVTYVNGQITKREVIEEKVLQQPINKIVAVGAKKLSVSTERNVIHTSRGAFRYRKTMKMNASAYAPDPRCTGKWGRRTASGMRAGYGVVAVDRGVIPLGTRLYIEGYGHAIAGDVGGAIRGNRIDLCFETYNQALRFGRRTMRVYVLE